MTPKPRTSLSAKNRKIIWFAAVALLLAAAGGYVYSSKTTPAPQNANASSPQTEFVRRGDLAVTAGGSGVLTAQTDANFGFETSGQVTAVYIKLGDPVEKGQVLAQLDDTLAQMEYEEAEQALQELYSAASIAEVEQEIGAAQDTEFYAREWLEYLISPEVLEAEENLAIAQQRLAEAQAEAEANPSDEANQKVKEKQKAVDYLEDILGQAQTYYKDEYLFENFAVYETVGRGRNAKQVLQTEIDPVTGEEVPEIDEPSIDDIAVARNNYAQAQETSKEDKVYLEVLKTGVIPEGATGERLTTLYNAQQAVEEAKAALEDAKLIAPISGTITTLDLRVGEYVEKATTSSEASEAFVPLDPNMVGQEDSDSSLVITISQLSQPYIVEVYLDEADWNLAKVGNKANITFDLLGEQSFSGTVALVYPELVEGFESSLVHVLVQMDQRISQDLPAGTGATVEVVGAEAKGVLLVSVDALQKTEDGKYTVTVLQNGQQVERSVAIGLQSDTYAEVKSGLIEGEIVVTQ